MKIELDSTQLSILTSLLSSLTPSERSRVLARLPHPTEDSHTQLILIELTLSRALLFDASVRRANHAEPPVVIVPANVPVLQTKQSSSVTIPEGWTKWEGGDEAPTEGPGEVMFRDGSIGESSCLEMYSWKHLVNHGDIIAYKSSAGPNPS